MKKKPKQYKKGIEWLSEQIDLSVLFRIKGRQGLYLPVTKSNKGGMLRMVRFSDKKESYTVNRNILSGLDQALIKNEKHGEFTTLGQAFDNLQKKFENKIIPQDTYRSDNDVLILYMCIICPGYDPQSFKVYHAIKIILWYNELILSIQKADAGD